MARMSLKVFSPRKRGWPMDTHCPAFGDDRFPRASGNGPSRLWGMSARMTFSPREQGWSVGGDIVTQNEDVFPVHAGMVPVMRATQWQRSSFPRESGDGPGAAATARATKSFSPRKQRWSVGRADCCAESRCFPRASGDGPGRLRRTTVEARFSPRERRWSAPHPFAVKRKWVFPAQAGMVRQQRAAEDGPEDIPRASGDDPI